MATGWRKFPKHKVLQAIKSSGGVKLLICQRLKCDRSTFDRYLENTPEIRAAFESEIEEVGDMVESKIIQGIKDGNTALTIFYAKTKLKARGYIERQEVETNQPLIIQIDQKDANV